MVRGFRAAITLAATVLWACSDGAATLPEQYALTLVSSGGGALTSQPPGIDCRADCLLSSVIYARGTVVTLSAQAAVGQLLVGWSGDCTGQGPCELVMDQDRHVEVTFTTTAYPLVVTTAGSGGGAVTSTPSRIHCQSTSSVDCTAAFPFNSQVTLTASPDADSEFAGWSGACEGPGLTCVLTIDRAKGAVATFTRKRFELTVEMAGSGRGRVLSEPAGIDCGAACGATFDSGTTLVLHARPEVTAVFLGWAGACSGLLPDCSLRLDEAKRATATFATITYPLSVLRTSGGAVTASVGGIDCGAHCSADLDVGTVVTLTAAPALSADFAGWTGDCVGLEACVVTMDGPRTVAARFTYPLTARKVGNGAGEVTSAPSGIACGERCAASYDPGTVVTLTATPDVNSSFVSWAGACDGTEACMVTLSEARTVTAAFRKNVYALVVNRNGTGGGLVSSAPAGIDCGARCAANYESGQRVTLTASPDALSSFTGWSGACSGTGLCVIDVDRVAFVTAQFTKITFPLTVTRTGAGTVTSDPLGIFCGSVCATQFEIGMAVRLAASPDAGAQFQGWGGACTGTGACVVSLEGARNVTATFSRNAFALSVSRVGTGGGAVVSVPPGIECGSTCSTSFQSGTLVTLAATPDGSSNFSGWTGACAGTGLCVVTVDAVMAVNATFTRQTHFVTVSLGGSGSGRVTSSPTGLDCGARCSAAYAAGTVVSLSATPDANSTFVGWTGGCTGGSVCAVTVSGETPVTANFARVRFALGTSVVSGGGTILSDPFGIFCGPLCSASYESGAAVTLTAMPDATATFAGWRGACTGTGPCSVVMDAARTVSARFTYRLTVSKNNSAGGDGVVESSVPGLSCGPTCAAEFDPDTQVTLTARPNSTSLFTGWSGACAGSTSCVVNLDSAKGVTASFTSNLLQLTVNRTGTGAGTVTSTPAGVSCGAACVATYLAGTQVRLTATPASSGSVFAGWSGACSGSGTCTVTLDSSKSATATFTRVVYGLSVDTGRGGGVVTSSPAGLYCGAVCAAEFDAGTIVTLTAAPDVTARFAGWSGACTGTGDCVVTLDAAKSVAARFTYRLSVTRSGSGAGSVTSSPAGIGCGTACTSDFERAQVLTLGATADSGSTFSGWSGACVGTGVCTLAMDAEKSVTATFTRGAFALTVARTGNGLGAVVSNPAGLDCGATCTASFDASAQVTLTAAPDVTSVFAGWSGACSGTGTCVASMDSARNVTATFTRRRFVLTVTRSGPGTVTGSTGGIFCGAACTDTYDAGTSVLLTATPDATAAFLGWTGVCSGTSTCTVSIDAAKGVGAAFSTNAYALAVTRAGQGAGTVTSTPAGIDCGVSCTQAYDSGTVVSLTAQPSAISVFSGWSGACTGNGACTVTVSQARTVTATFEKNHFAVTVARTGSGGGLVSSAPAGLDCGNTCSASFDGGASLTLTAAADASSTFTGWAGPCAGTAACTLTVDGAKAVTATFVRRSYALTVTRAGAGVVTSDPQGVYCGAVCAASFDAGASVTLVAQAELTASFLGWSGACTGTGACTVAMTAARSVTATFTTNTYALTVTRLGSGTGAVSSTPAGLDCGSTCAASYDSGTVVTLSAAPSPTSLFTGWSGACTGAGACTVTLSQARAVSATFEKGRFTLAVTRLGSGGGAVVSSPAGLDCGSTCSFDFEGGQGVILTATADGNSTFAGWSGACSGTGTCAVSMSAARSVSATFARNAFTLTLTRAGEGTVTSAPAGLYCGAACASAFDAGATVVLTAAPQPQTAFAGWSGACNGVGTCTLTMNSNKTVNATFVSNTFNLQVAKAGAGDGSVTSTPAGVDCGGTCTATYDAGTVVTLTATANGLSTFTGWSGACTGPGACTVSLSVARSVTANFARARFAVAVSKSGTGSGSVLATPAGLDCGATCSASYDGGTALSLTATPDADSTFAGWSGACAGTGSCLLTVDGAKAVGATFARRAYTLTVQRSGRGTVTSAPAGVYCGAACAVAFDAGATVTLTALPDATATFAGWSGACTGSAACSVTMTAARTVSAVFATSTFSLTVGKSGAGAGSVVSTPAGIDCGSTCTQAFDADSVVTLSAAPNATSVFAGWSGACTGAGACTMTLSAARAVTATFALQSDAVSVVKRGSGKGVVTSSPAGLECGNTCAASWPAGTVVTFSAAPDSSSSFTGWTGACTGTGNCTVTLAQATTVTATFDAYTYALTVDAGHGGGVIASEPVGIYCGADCSQSYLAATVVALTAVPEPGATFVGWTGACAGTAPCVVTVDAPRTVGARFVFPLGVSRTGTGAGAVTSSPAGLDCGATCSADYDNGAVVTLAALPDSQSVFGGWSGACSGTGSCTVTMDGARSVTASFVRATYALTVSRTGSGGGTVASLPTGISCGLSCAASYAANTVLALTATADATSTFTGWSGACTGTGACSVTVDGSKFVSATFSRNFYTLQVARSGSGGGTITSQPLALFCGATCSASFESASVVTLSATPDSRSTFAGWSGACSGTADCVVTLSAARSATATFTLDNFTVAVVRAGSGAGVVTSVPAALSCGNTCSASFSSGTQVTLVPTPSATSFFAGWSGDCAGTSACTLVADRARTVTATFTTQTYAFSVSRLGSGGGTITSQPAGISCGSTCSAVFDAYTTLTLAATADSLSTFAGWSGACAGTTVCSVTLDAARSVSATFTRNAFLLTVNRTGSGTVTSSPLAIYCGATCSASVDSGTQLTLTATPDAGARFLAWTGACAGTGATCTLTVSAAATVSATFATNSYALTVSRGGLGGGGVASSPAGVDCGATCSATYTAGTLVALSATPDVTSVFTGWSGACTGTGQCVLVMDAARAVTASFTPNLFTLTVTRNGSGAGTLSSAPAGISCEPTCAAPFTAGTLVTLTAAPDANSQFDGWSGACTGTGACALTLDAARSVSATFTRRTYALTVTRAGPGTVTSSPLAIFCGATCVAAFESGTTVVLTPAADAGATFTGWSGACTGTGACSVPMAGARSVTASFVANTYPLTVTRAGTGGGAVSTSPVGLDCGATCTASFASGTVVLATAAPDALSVFSGWGGACTGSQQCLVTLDAAKTLTATFLPNTFSLTVTRAGSGTGTVASAPAGISCGSGCGATYDAGTLVTLTATSAATATFDGWSGACSGTAECRVEMTAVRAVTATFSRRQYALTLSRSGGGTVTSAPAGVYCGASCSASFPAEQVVTLTAATDSGATFAGWDGACAGTSATCTVTMDQARSVSARFTFPLTASLAGSGSGTVASTPAGVSCGTTCSAAYDGGTLVTLAAAPDATSAFAGWSGACAGTSSCTLAMDSPRSAIATFTRSTFILSVGRTGTGSGTVTSNPAGLSCGTGCSATYVLGSQVALAAAADATSTFVGWTGACTGTGACSVTVDAAKSVTATFSRTTYALTVTRTPGGSVTSSPLGVFCGAACSATFDAQTPVTLLPSPDAGATFAGWSGACTGSGACVVTLDAARSVGARFTFPVTVQKAGSGLGTVTASSPGLSCGATCVADYDGGSVLTLTAAPSTSATFAGWSGPCAGTGTCELAVDSAKVVTATFMANTSTVSVTRQGSGDGRVTSSPAGLDCGAACVATFEQGAIVTLSAVAAADSSFASWGGACAGASGASCTLTASAARSVTATFSRVTYVVNVARAGSGSISSSPPAIFCGTACSASFTSGTVVTLSAAPDAGASFTGWGGACVSASGATCTVSVDAAKNVTATFTNPLTITRTGTGTGAVASTPGGIACGATCGASFAPGTVVTLSALANPDSVFGGWTGACSGTDACPVTLDQARSVTATFTRASFALSVTRTGSGGGAVSSSPVGISCGAACLASFDAATVVTLTAVPDATSDFTGWSGACAGAGTCTVTLAGTTSVSATFTRRRFGLTVTRNGPGTVTADSGGLFCGAACSATYDAGTQVTLTALADATSAFSGWSGLCTGTGTCALTLDAAKTVTATFTTNTFVLAVAHAGLGTGQVVSTPAGVDCGATCSGSYASGTVVTLSAAPSPTSVFAGWSGACSGAGACTLTMSAARSVTATFDRGRYALTVTRLGTGGGAVTSTPAAIDCGTTCSAPLDAGTVLVLAASPDANSTFSGWSGACTGTGTCSVTLDAAKAVSATFTRGAFTLTLARTGSGTVTSSPGGLYCGAVCSASFDAGATITLTAAADGSATFSGWGGACSGTVATCAVTMSAARSVTATFTTNRFALSVGRAGTGAGSVGSTPAGIDCGGTCSAQFDAGTVLTLSATPSATSTFTAWSGACSGAGACTVTLDGAKSVTATFALATFALTVNRAGTGGGTVSSTPTGVSCGIACAPSFDGGTVVTLAAVADGNSTFAGWTGAGCSGTGSCVVAVDAAKTVTATFSRNQFTLSLLRTGSGTVVSAPAGVYCGASCSAAFDAGATVTLTAAPDASAAFTGWSGSGCTGTGTCAVIMSAARSVTATFTTNRFQLTVARAGLGLGTVSSTPAGIECGLGCSALYDAGTVLTLSATPAATSTFFGWSGSCAGTGPCTLTLDGAKTVTATFALASYPLTVNLAGTGLGAVASTPTGLSCGTACTASFTAGTAVTLTPTATVGSSFTGWTGACTGTGACIVAMNSAQTVGATFSAFTYSLSVDLGAGGGVVASDLAGIYCGADCSESYAAATAVTLTATPAPGATFLGWGGACSGTQSTCGVVVDQARSVSARFAFTLNITRAGSGSGAVSSSPAAIACGSGGACSASFDNAAQVTLTATPDATSLFTGWSGACGGTGACTVSMDGARTASATFTRAAYTLTVSKTGSGTGTVTSTPIGVACGSTCSATYTAATVVALAAVADSTASFAGWSGACAGTTSCSVTLDGAKSVTATFVRNTFVLTVTRNGGGTVTSSPLALFCGATCAATFDSGAAVTLTATPDAGTTFTGWGGVCSGTAGCSVTMDGARAVTATFVPTTYSVSVTLAGSGSVASTPVGVSCGTTCAGSFNAGALVTLTATPTSTTLFSGWSGACTSASPQCVLSLDGPKAVTATFLPLTYALSVSRTGSGGGTVSSLPIGVSCGNTCSAAFTAGTGVVLTAAADSVSTFAGWSGACTGTGTCSVTVDAAKSVSATFTKNTFVLTVTRVGNGVVTSAPLAVYCGATCAASFDAATVVTLTATANPGAGFSGWGGPCSGTGTCAVTLNAATAVTATFVTTNYDLVVSKTGAGTGAVTSSPAGVDCGATCTGSFASGTLVTLSAAPGSTSVFAGWSGACSGTGQCLLAMDVAKSVAASFVPNTFALSVLRVGTGGGTVTSNPTGLSCGTGCSATYNAGSVVVLTAAADVNSTFDGWTGACTGTSTCSVTVDSSKTVSATFTRKLFTVSILRTAGGTVTSDPSGVYCGAACSASFASGTTATLVASAEPGASFAGWSGACTGTAPCTLTIDGAKSVSARFTYLLTVQKSGSAAATSSVSASVAGIACGATCSAPYDGGSSVTLTATPAANATFAGWGGPCGGTGTCLVTLDASKLVTATFTTNTYALSVTRLGGGDGRVTSLPAGLDCGAACIGSFDVNTAVTLSATPEPNSAFSGWSGSCTGTGACVVTLDAARAVTASFTRVTYSVTVARAGAGLVVSSPPGIYCGAACAASFDSGSTVTLTATSDTGAVFSGWSGACSGNGATCTLAMGAAKAVSATFTVPLTVAKTGTGTGTVTSVPTGISCGATCAANFTSGTAVVLTASADATSQFAGWSGACSGTGTCAVTLSEARSVTAIFLRASYFLFLNRGGTGGGSVASSPLALDCGATCAASFDGGTLVTLAATPDANSDFGGWTGACTGLTTCSVTMDATKSVTFTFIRRQYRLNLTKTGPGTVISSPAGILCAPACNYDYDAGTLVSLTPVADFGADFGEWTGGGCTGNGICTVPMNQVRNVTARFGYTLSVARSGGGGGTLTSSPTGISCGVDCTDVYNPGTVVALSQTPSTNGTFLGWTGSCSGTTACSVTLDQARSVFATYSFPFTVRRTGTGGGTVASSPVGIDCGTSCVTSFTYGQTVTLTATPNATAVFTGWTGSCTGTGSTCTVNVDGLEDVTARFVYPLSVTATGGGSVTSSPSGINCTGTTCTATFDPGVVVTLTPTASLGAAFIRWTGACTGSGACAVTMDNAKSVSAEFSYPLTVTRTGGGGGNVTSVPTGIACGATCTASYLYGTSVVLTAAPNPGATFLGWSGGGCSGTGTCTLTVDAAKTVNAQFNYPLTLTKTGTGNGAGVVSSTNVAGIDCGLTCTNSFPYNTTVALSAVPVSTATFFGWTAGPCAGSALTTCSVPMTAVQAVTARFVYTLTALRAGGGGGTVTSSAGGLSCGTTCSAIFDQGDSLTLSASPDATGTFTGWSGGGCSGTGLCGVTMDQSKSVTATFTFPLSFTKSGTGGGTVNSSPGGITCGLGCSSGSASYTYGQSVTLTAAPDTTSTFTNWSGGCTGSALTCTVSLTTARSVTAVFTRNTFAVTASKSGTGGGTIASTVPDARLGCGSFCTQAFDEASTVTFTAAPDSTSVFAGWGGSCAAFGTGTTCTVTIVGAVSISAAFTRIRYDLTVTTPAGGGTVSSNVGGIACGTGCLATFDAASVVLLTANPSTGAVFSAWGGACAGQLTATCTLTMSAPLTASVVFAWPLTIAKVGTLSTGGGDVNANTGGLACGATCTRNYNHGSSVILSATPLTGAVFIGWTSGGCSGTAACTLAITAATTVTARFAYPLTVTATGGGSVSSSPAGITACTGASCSANFDPGQVVTLTPTASAGAAFRQWTGACTGSGACLVTMDQVRAVGAEFSYPLTVSVAGGGTVASTNIAGIACSPTCSAPFLFNQSVTLAATPATGASFAGWSGACTNTTGTCTVTLAAARAVTAIFNYPLNVTKTGTGLGGGTVTSTNFTGIACGATCSFGFAYGSSVTLSAAPDSTSTFASWTVGPCAGSAVSTCTVPATQVQNVTARFVYTLTVTRGTGGGGGTVSGGAISCGTVCSAVVDPGTVVPLTASASTGGTFAGWSGSGCSGTGGCSVTLDQSRSVDALFTFPLTVAKAGTGQGTVTSTNVAGVSCGTACLSQTASFNYAQSVILSAAGDGTSNFSGWSGACTNTSGTCTVALGAVQSVTATFTRRQQTLTITKSGTGVGTVTSTVPDARIACGGTCSGTFDELQSVTLTAAPDATSVFSGWGGACASFGTGTTCTVSLVSALTATASFTRITYDLTVTTPVGGSITSDVGSINCGGGGACLATYVALSTVNLTAVIGTGAVFSAWGGACLGTVGNVCTLSMTGPKAVSVSFVYPVTVTSSGGGTVTASGINCGTICSASYAPASSVVFTANLGTGATFGGWGGACAFAGTASTCTLTINGASSLSAGFKQTLTIGSVSGSGTITGTGLSCPGTSCNTTVAYGTAIPLTATPAAGWTLGAWGGDCSGNGACTATLTANRNVTATFTQVQVSLAVAMAGAATGTVTSAPLGIACTTGTCSSLFNQFSSVVLTAAPAVGATFGGWSGGGCTGTAPCTVSMATAQSVTATFNVAQYTLTLTYSGSGSVSVTPPTATCSTGSCTYTYNAGTPVTLVATPGTGSTFGIWSGCDSSSSNTCTLTMGGSRTISTGFNLVSMFTLAASYQGTAGSIRSTTAAYLDRINCGSTCSATFTSGTVLRLVAAAASSDYFVSSWTGCTSWSGNTCDVTLTANTSVVAIFALSPTNWISACDQTAVARYFTTPTDDASVGVTIPFTFNFKGTDYTTAYPSTNGLVSFGSGSGSWSNGAIPSAAVPAATIFAFWDDLYTTANNGICVATVGVVGARKFVVTWDRLYFYPSADGTSLTFSVILYETSNVVDIIYYDMSSPQSGTANGASATIGIQWAQTGTSFLQYSFNTSSIANGTSIRY